MICQFGIVIVAVHFHFECFAFFVYEFLAAKDSWIDFLAFWGTLLCGVLVSCG